MVDVGVASNKWPAVTASELTTYARNTANAGYKPAVILNACGSAWGQDVNFRLDDGTMIVNSVCVGPSANDTSNGHYLCDGKPSRQTPPLRILQQPVGAARWQRWFYVATMG